MGPLGIPELIFIFVLALLIFGPKKLPEIGRSFGKGIAEFRRASNELRATFQREMDAIDEESKQVKEVAHDVSKDLNAKYYGDGGDDYYPNYGETSSEAPASEGNPAHDSATQTAASQDATSSPNTEAISPGTGSAEPQNGHETTAATDENAQAASGSKAETPETKPTPAST